MHWKLMKPQDGVITATVISTASLRVPSVMSEQETESPFSCQVQLTPPDFLNSSVQKKTKWYFETSVHIQKFLPGSQVELIKKKKKERKASLLAKGLIHHFSFLFVIPVIFVSYALAKKGDSYLLELGFNKHYALW